MHKKLTLAGLLVASLSISACGGGSSGNSFSLKSYAPTPHGVENVEPDTPISANFSADVGSTQPAGSFVLQGPSGLATGELTINGRDVVFVPAVPLALSAAYQAKFSTGLVSATGRPLRADFDWQFSTRDGAWTDWKFVPEQTLGTGSLSDAQVGIDNAGNAVAVWLQEDVGGTTKKVYANHYHAASQSWSQPSIISTPTSALYNLTLAVGANGQAIIVWNDYDNSRLYASRYTPVTGFSIAAEVAQNNANHIEAGVDGEGNALVAWEWRDASSLDRLVARRFNASSNSWEAAQPLDQGSSVRSPSLTVSTAGHALLTWSQINAGVVTVYARRYSTLGWTAAQEISDPTVQAEYADDVVAAMDSIGRAVVLIYYKGPLNSTHEYQIDALTLSTQGDWSSPSKLAEGSVFEPSLAISEAGTAIASWEASQNNSFSDRELRSKQLVFATGWDTQEEKHVEAEQTLRNNSSRLLMDAAGNALAIWTEKPSSATETYSRRYLVGQGWGANEPRTEFLENHNLVMNDGGRVITFGHYGSGFFSSARFE